MHVQNYGYMVTIVLQETRTRDFSGEGGELTNNVLITPLKYNYYNISLKSNSTFASTVDRDYYYFIVIDQRRRIIYMIARPNHHVCKSKAYLHRNNSRMVIPTKFIIA